jgi:hypothetical protein
MITLMTFGLCNMAVNTTTQKSRPSASRPPDSPVFRVEKVSLSEGARVEIFGGSPGRQARVPLPKNALFGLRETIDVPSGMDSIGYRPPVNVATEAAAPIRKGAFSLRKRKHFAKPSDRLEYKAEATRFQQAVDAMLNRIPEILRVADQERADAIIKASIEAALPLQRGVREQAELAAALIADALGRIPMLTAREVGLNAASKSDKPEGLAAQWANRQQVFVLDLRDAGLRYPAFQFQPESGKPWPSLAKVLPRLQLEMPALDLLLWFDAPHPALGHAKPSDCLHNLDAIELALKDSTAPVDAY